MDHITSLEIEAGRDDGLTNSNRADDPTSGFKLWSGSGMNSAAHAAACP